MDVGGAYSIVLELCFSTTNNSHPSIDGGSKPPLHSFTGMAVELINYFLSSCLTTIHGGPIKIRPHTISPCESCRGKWRSISPNENKWKIRLRCRISYRRRGASNEWMVCIFVHPCAAQQRKKSIGTETGRKAVEAWKKGIVYRIRLSGGLWGHQGGRGEGAKKFGRNRMEEEELINDFLSGDITSFSVHLNKRDFAGWCA